MTQRICQFEGHFNIFASKLFYVRIGHGEEWTRYRLRFCAVHLRDVYEHLAQFEVNPTDGTLSGGDAAVTQCLTCRQPVGEVDWYLFLTSYPTKQDRKDHWARLHVDCRLYPLLEEGDHAEYPNQNVSN